MKKPGKVQKRPTAAQISEAMRILRAIPSECRSEASRINGRKGGRPKKIIAEILPEK